jgi:hypothetical protein
MVFLDKSNVNRGAIHCGRRLQNDAASRPSLPIMPTSRDRHLTLRSEGVNLAVHVPCSEKT